MIGWARVTALLLLAGCELPGPHGLPDGCRPAEAPYKVNYTHIGDVMHDGREVLWRLSMRSPDESGYASGDDGIRMHTRELCKPCEHWFEDFVPVDQMFPLELVPSATKAACFGLALKDGSVRYGAYRRRLTHPFEH